jgi:pyocin large subunit-like protein
VKKQLPVIVVVLLAALACVVVAELLRRPTPVGDAEPALRRPSATERQTATRRATSGADPVPNGVARPSVGFRTREQLLDHFEKHGRAFEAASPDEYLRLAQSLRDAPKGGAILEVVRATDGVVTRFDRKTGAFLAFNRDGTIRTVFRPDDGEAYFRRQVDREGEGRR